MTAFEDVPLFDLATGETLRDTGTTVAGSTTPGADTWRADAEAALDTLTSRRSEFSADDLVALVGPPPHPNMLGGLFLTASRAGLIVCVGITTGRRPSAHARLQRVWKGTDTHAG